MKGKKFKIIGGIISGVLGLTVVVVLGVKLFSVKDNPKVEDALKEEENKIVIQLKDNLNVEINSEVKITDLLDENNDIEIVNVDKKIDTSSLGEKELTIKYLENAEEKEYAFKINVIDTEKPTIKFSKELSTTVGTKINLLKNVKVSDNSKEEIKATVEGDYDFNKEGTYKLKYVAIDSSNNKTEEDFTLKVNKKKTTSTTNTTTNNNSTTTDKKEENPVIETKYEEKEIDRKEYKYGIEEYTIVKYKITTRKDGTEEKVEDSRLSYYELDKFRDDAKEMRSEASSNLTTYKQDINQLFNIINENRKANSFYEYKLDENLSLGASIRAMEVGFMNSYDNYRPNGKYFTTVLDDLGIEYSGVMESSTRGGIKDMQGVYNSLVLYCDYNDIDCQNIFSEKFTKIGIGMFKFNNDYSYVILFEK